jgi:hypothetical protein
VTPRHVIDNSLLTGASKTRVIDKMMSPCSSLFYALGSDNRDRPIMCCVPSDLLEPLCPVDSVDRL